MEQYPNDILREIHRRQGFVVIARSWPIEIGHILKGIWVGLGDARVTIPLRVVEKSSYDEFLVQHELVGQLIGRSDPCEASSVLTFFYRVEAAD